MDIITEIRSVIHRWCNAFVASDVDSLVNMYSSDTVFMGTSSQQIINSIDAIREYFVKAIRDRTPKSADFLELQIRDYGSMVVATALDRIEWSDSKLPQISLGRVTFVFLKTAQDWKIVSFHRSRLPQ
jgi:ketosteroid isomerase-like protein